MHWDCRKRFCPNISLPIIVWSPYRRIPIAASLSPHPHRRILPVKIRSATEFRQKRVWTLFFSDYFLLSTLSSRPTWSPSWYVLERNPSSQRRFEAAFQDSAAILKRKSFSSIFWCSHCNPSIASKLPVKPPKWSRDSWGSLAENLVQIFQASLSSDHQHTLLHSQRRRVS